MHTFPMKQETLSVPLMNLKAQHSAIADELKEAICRVIDRSLFVSGEEVTLFEEEFASFCGSNYAVAVASGTDALYLTLKGLGIGPGDEVITVPFTFVGTVAAITLNGARPVFVDILPQTFNMNPDLLEEAITEKTAAIIPVHLYGQPAQMDLINSVARRHGLAVVEDAAQAHGAEYKGVRVGALSQAACFSFYPSKNLGAMGEAGAVATNDKNLYQTLRSLRNHGRSTWNEHGMEGVNSRMDEIQGAVLRVKLRHLEEWNRLRREKAALYDKLLEGIPGIITPHCVDGAKHVYHLYVIRAAARDALKERLGREGIATGIYYPLPVHRQKAYYHLKMEEGSFPVSEGAARQVMSLPLWPEMEEKLVEYVADRLRAVIKTL